MNARTRLVLSAVLFAAWIGWLAYLAATATRPIVLSRPQLLVSTLDVIARVDADGDHPAATVPIVKVHWPPGRDDWKDKTITVSNLPECSGWDGPGEYILPLVNDAENYQVARLPRSPGYPGPSAHGPLPPLRIYRRAPETERQLEAIPKPDRLSEEH